jgi:hypothetical protein
MNTTELFLQAVNAYKAWINTGMDFKDFTHLFLVWDEAVIAYMSEAGINRMEAIYQVRKALGMGSI